MKLELLSASADSLLEGIPESARKLMQSSLKMEIDSTCVGALMIFCGGLVMAIDDDMPLVCEKLASVVAYKDHVGFCCFGEQGRMASHSSAQHGNLMFGCMMFYK